MLSPYICLPDTVVALEWYGSAMGAEVTVEPMVMPDGRVGHAEFVVAGARVMAFDPHSELQVVAPDPAGAAVTLQLDLADAATLDDVVARAAEAGATIDRGPTDNPPIGRLCVLRDPFGHRWFLIAPLTQSTPV